MFTIVYAMTCINVLGELMLEKTCGQTPLLYIGKAKSKNTWV